MSTSIAPRIVSLSARVVIPGIPPNWSQWRGHSVPRDAQKAVWRDLARLLGHSARNSVHWPLPVHADPPARRYLQVVIYKRRPFYDPDGAVSCLKPLIDGACRRVLAWDDSLDWLALITPPAEMQREVEVAAAERVVLTVHLVDPRSAAAEERLA